MTVTGTIHNVNIQPMTTQIGKTIMIIFELQCVNMGCHYVITPYSVEFKYNALYINDSTFANNNKNACCATLLQLERLLAISFLLFLYSVVDVDFSISRVVIHGHIFSHCVTTGRGPGVGNRTLECMTSVDH